jgi:hypothetical protein
LRIAGAIYDSVSPIETFETLDIPETYVLWLLLLLLFLLRSVLLLGLLFVLLNSYLLAFVLLWGLGVRPEIAISSFSSGNLHRLDLRWDKVLLDCCEQGRHVDLRWLKS